MAVKDLLIKAVKKLQSIQDPESTSKILKGVLDVVKILNRALLKAGGKEAELGQNIMGAVTDLKGYTISAVYELSADGSQWNTRITYDPDRLKNTAENIGSIIQKVDDIGYVGP